MAFNLPITSVKYLLLMMTGYIVIWYTLDPNPDRCLMSFMMEPPKFIDMSVKQDDSNLATNSYRLFLYSEFDFPPKKEAGHDLVDSFPVLFVPGNAGSYQQVRSLASTCTRRQLQSLNAFKFVFYTIDFGGQLSGLSGDLVEYQTTYVNKCLHRIRELQPGKFNGIILIGHSVGGFISKSLFALPGFDFGSVPLLISLSSPLVRPYLNFDYKMTKLYERTYDTWQQYRSDINKTTVAISISGGKFDKLVPTHLAQDPQFDLSMTTANIKDVWFHSDHNSITWCREFMFKLSHILSAVMDGPNNRILPDRIKLLDVIESQLLTRIDPQLANQISAKEWKTSRPASIFKFHLNHQIYRHEFGDDILLADISDSHDVDIMIVIDHNMLLKPNGFFACFDIEQSKSGQISCVEKINLLNIANPIPSSIYESQRTIIKLARNQTSKRINYIGFDLLPSERNLPETVIIIETNFQSKTHIYLPSILGYLSDKIFQQYIPDIRKSIGSPLIYSRHAITNQYYHSRFYSINIRSHSCKDDASPNVGITTLYHDGYLIEGFASNPRSSDRSLIKVNLDPDLYVMTKDRGQYNNSEKITIMESYLDGNCEHSITLEWNFLSMLARMIRSELDIILVWSSFLNLYMVMLNLQRKNPLTILEPIERGFIFGAIAFWPLRYREKTLFNSHFSHIQSANTMVADVILHLICLFSMAYGIVLLFGFLIDRLIDIAIILNRLPTYFIKSRTREKSESTGKNQSESRNRFMSKSEMTILIVACTSSFVLSAASASLVGLLYLIRAGLYIDGKRRQTIGIQNNEILLERAHGLLINVGTSVIFIFIANIPAGLLKIKLNDSIVSSSSLLHLDNVIALVVGSATVLVIRSACHEIEIRLYRLEDRTKTGAKLTAPILYGLLLLCIVEIYYPMNLTYIIHAFTGCLLLTFKNNNALHLFDHHSSNNIKL